MAPATIANDGRSPGRKSAPVLWIRNIFSNPRNKLACSQFVLHTSSESGNSPGSTKQRNLTCRISISPRSKNSTPNNSMAPRTRSPRTVSIGASFPVRCNRPPASRFRLTGSCEPITGSRSASSANAIRRSRTATRAAGWTRINQHGRRADAGRTAGEGLGRGEAPGRAPMEDTRIGLAAVLRPEECTRSSQACSSHPQGSAGGGESEGLRERVGK